jgi:hypothetical protein
MPQVCPHALTSPSSCSAEEEATCVKAVRAFLPHRTTIIFTHRSNGAAAAGNAPPFLSPPHNTSSHRHPPSLSSRASRVTPPAAHRLYLLSGAGSGRVIAATGGAGGALEPTRYHPSYELFIPAIAPSFHCVDFSTLHFPPSRQLHHAAAAAGAAGEDSFACFSSALSPPPPAASLSSPPPRLITRWQVQSAGVQSEPLNRALADLRRML